MEESIPGNISVKKSIIKTAFIIVIVISIFGATSFAGASYYQSTRLIREADNLRKEGDYTTAQNKYNQALIKWKWNSSKISTKIRETNNLIVEKNYFDLGEGFYQKQNWQDCVDYFSNITSRSPNYGEAQVKLVYCQGKISDAQAIAKAEAEAKIQADAAKKAVDNSTSTVVPKKSTANSSSTKSSTVEQSHGSTAVATSVDTSGALPNTIPVYTYGVHNYYYVGGRQFVSASGASAKLTQAKPAVAQTNGSENHSLMELAVESKDGQQVVEIGWMIDKIFFGDDSPHLFVFHWVNGQPSCYNVCGFTQVSSVHVPGEALSVNSVGDFKIDYSSGNWNLYYNSDNLGYFPGSLWPNNFTQAEFVGIFGEVETDSTTTGIQMGNGILGSIIGSAQISDYKLYGSSTTPSLSPYKTAPSPYDYGSSTSTGLNLGG